MARDRRFNIFGEVRVNRGRGVFGKQGNALGNGTPNGLWEMQYRNRPFVFFDDNFRTRTHTRQERGDISCRSFGLRNVNYTLRHKASIHPHQWRKT